MKKHAIIALIGFFVLTFALSTYSYFQNTGLVAEQIAKQRSAAAESAPQIYWGARMDGEVYGTGDAPWDDTTWNTFEQHTGKKASIIHYGVTYPAYYKDHVSMYQKVKSRGAISLITWSTANLKLKDIASGLHDDYFKAWGQQAAASGIPMFVRLDWEMNGGWYPWATTPNNQYGNTPADYIAMWRHIHDVVEGEGAKNITWTWCPNVNFSGSTPLKDIYPGDAYVDWTCFDGYNFSTLKGVSWQTFSQVVKPTYDQLLQIAPSKPIIIAEFGSTELGAPSGTSKAAWITDAIATQIPTNFPKIKGIVWFNWNIVENNQRADWQIESSTNSQNAFAGAIASPVYAANIFSNLANNTKVQPLAAPLSATPTPQSTLGATATPPTIATPTVTPLATKTPTPVPTPTPDLTAPIVAITQPLADAQVTANVTIAADVSDNIGVTKVEFYIDGILKGTDTSVPYSITTNSTTITNGIHTVVARGYDAAGNAGRDTLQISISNGDTTPPSTPANLSGQAIDYKTISLTWSPSTDSSGIGSYWVLRNNVTVGQASSNSYTDQGLLPATQYAYQVIAVDTAGNSSPASGTFSIATPAQPDTTAPTIPTNVSAKAVSSSQINLSWSASTDNIGLAGYDIYRNGQYYRTVTASTSFGDTGVTPSTQYSYYIRAKDTSNNLSGQSNTASATSLAVITNGRIVGNIYNTSLRGIPYAKAIITIGGSTQTVSADSSGYYSIANIPPGTYSVTYTAKRYKSLTVSVVVPNGGTASQNITLQNRK